MKLTYLFHSGFTVEMEDAVFIFDYYKGVLPRWNAKKTVYVFASHQHYDHFTPEIFRWREDYPDIHYILSDDIRKAECDSGTKREDLGEHVTVVGPDQEIKIGGCTVRTLQSTDEGVAFLVKYSGNVLFHAGDLNWWHWDEESDSYNERMRQDYQREIQKLEQEQIDIAFVPLDVRQGDAYRYGMDYFIRHVDARLIVPMHFWEDYTLAKRYVEESPELEEGHLWLISGQGEELVWNRREVKICM